MIICQEDKCKPIQFRNEKQFSEDQLHAHINSTIFSLKSALKNEKFPMKSFVKLLDHDGMTSSSDDDDGYDSKRRSQSHESDS